MIVEQLRFAGQTFIALNKGPGPLTTPSLFQSGRCSYAYLYPNGNIKRFNVVIGYQEDIEWLGQIEIDDPDPLRFIGGLPGLSWEKEQ